MSISRRNVLQRQALAGLSLLGLPYSTALATESADLQSDVRVPLALRVKTKLVDAAELLVPSALKLQGWLGERTSINARRRLLNMDMEPLLAGFQHKPGSHPWIGEHVGKWLHAATLAWAGSGDVSLRAKLDRVVTALVAAQEKDGYLGTYVPEQRFGIYDNADWDVWSHKYCLIGLLTYHQYTGDANALQACCRAADLLIATFPAQRSILAAGLHEGMAATSVLEPIVLLYRITGEESYLRFAQYIVRSWDEPQGPAIVKSLLAGRPVNKVSNGKAYEMLSNLVGLCELARVTGEHDLLQAVLNAWQDVVTNRLYATGSTSQWEHFQDDHNLKDGVSNHVAETCVTTTWIQLNLVLLQITGEARFGDELERTFYNHLSAAQHPDGDDWCYFTPLEGRKQYDQGITCCHSSGPRGLALAPQAGYLRGHASGSDVLLVSTFETSSATLMLNGERVSVEQRSEFPFRGKAVLTLRMKNPARFALKLRCPTWARALNLPGARMRAGWAEIPQRNWSDGDTIPISYQLAARIMTGEASNLGRAALAWGPFVLAYEQQANPNLPSSRELGLLSGAIARAARGGRSLQFASNVSASSQNLNSVSKYSATFVPFADAGAGHGSYRVWLRAPGVSLDAARRSESLLTDGEESRSRSGNVAGSIIDHDLSNLVNTWDGQMASEDWFAVTLGEHISASRFVFTHGRNYHDGGWFDTQAGKPQVQVQRTLNGSWDSIGVLQEYPATSAADPGDLVQGQSFALQLNSPVRFLAIRVIGKPSSGDRPQQAFVTCAELQAFSK